MRSLHLFLPSIVSIYEIDIIFIFRGYIMNCFNDQLLVGLLGCPSCAYDQDAHSVECIYTTYKTDGNYRQWVLTLPQWTDNKHEFENLVPWVLSCCSKWMHIWSSPKPSSATTKKIAFSYRASSKWTEVSDSLTYLNPQQYM